MAISHFSVETGQETLLAVALGAALATVGGFLAGQFEHAIHRRERERNAALLFGEILSSLKLVIRLADDSRRRGDPYGMVTQRMVRAAQRETDTYDRNREALFDLRQSAVRAQIHTLLVRIILALDGVLSAYDAINQADLPWEPICPSPPRPHTRRVSKPLRMIGWPRSTTPLNCRKRSRLCLNP